MSEESIHLLPEYVGRHSVKAGDLGELLADEAQFAAL